MKSTRLLSIPVYFLFGIALLISAGCKKTPGSPTSVTYTISFDKNGGTGDSPAAIIFTYNQENIRAPVKPAGLSAPAEKNFAGWNTEADGSGDNYPVNSPLNSLADREQDITLYAQWDVSGKTYTISFNVNKGTGDPPPAITFTHNLKKLKAPVKPEGLSAPIGKILAGWNTKANRSGADYAVGASLDTLTARAQDATLYAGWNDQLYTISFNANGGTGDSPAAITFTYNQEGLRAPEKPAGLSAPAEKNFAGWNTKRDGSGTDYFADSLLNELTKRPQDATLYARWKVWVVTTIAGGSG